MPKEYTVEKINIIARSPFHVYFEGQAKVISATNKVGNFDILPGHADFFSVLSPCEVIIEKTSSEQPVKFNINNGIMTVQNNQVMLFVDI
jgi:F0F1-type ATP synthase epsilon subunit